MITTLTIEAINRCRDELLAQAPAQASRAPTLMDQYLNHYCGFSFPREPREDAKAAKKGLKLLKDWLSPDQLKQYEKDKTFEVVGCDTGKRYRIRQGRQINIDEFDADGKVACNWCFLPEGFLCEGDTMLAQKIALETNETEALKVANRFGINRRPVDWWNASMGVDQVGYSGT